MRLIDADKLMEYAQSLKSRTIDCNDIARFPTAEQRPKGHWVYKDTGAKYKLCRCSICNRLIYVGDNQTLADFPYCHCGADMRGY